MPQFLPHLVKVLEVDLEDRYNTNLENKTNETDKNTIKRND